MNAIQEHSSNTGSGNFNTDILQTITENFKNHDINEEQDRYMDRGNQIYRSISYYEVQHLPLVANNGPILRKTAINIAPRTAEEKHVSIISRLTDTEKYLNFKSPITSRRHHPQQKKTWKGSKWKVQPNYKEQESYPRPYDENGGNYQDIVTENSPDHGKQKMTTLWRFKPSLINQRDKLTGHQEPTARAIVPPARVKSKSHQPPARVKSKSHQPSARAKSKSQELVHLPYKPTTGNHKWRRENESSNRETRTEEDSPDSVPSSQVLKDSESDSDIDATEEDVN